MRLQIYFLFPGEQGNLAHLVHIHPNRVVQDFQAGVVFFFPGRCVFRRFGTFRALGFGLIHHDFHIQTPQFGEQSIQIIRTQIIGQNVIDVVIGDVAMLLAQMQQRLDRFRQIN